MLALDAGTGPNHESAAAAGSGVSRVRSDPDREVHRLQAQAKVLVGIAQLTVNRGDLCVAEEAASRSLELYRNIGRSAEARMSWSPWNFGRSSSDCYALFRVDSSA